MTNYQQQAETAQELIRCLRHRPGVPPEVFQRLVSDVLAADREGARFWWLFDGPGFRSQRVLQLTWHGGSTTGTTWIPERS